MPFIFRKLRFSFFLPGKLRTYFVYAIGEIVLVVAGILIALQINTWNQNSTNRELERNFLFRIEKDLEKDLSNFAEQQSAGLAGLDSLKEAIILIHQNNQEKDLFKFNELYDLAWIETLSPQSSTYIEMESTGRLSLIQDDALRLAILEHYAYYKQMEVEFDRMFVWHKSITHDMDANTSILKYVNWNNELFPQQTRKESDWSYINEPQHPHFQKTEIAIAATSYWINRAINDYTAIVSRTETLKTRIAEMTKLMDTHKPGDF